MATQIEDLAILKRMIEMGRSNRSLLILIGDKKTILRGF
jgi:hypothetical protein